MTYMHWMHASVMQQSTPKATTGPPCPPAAAHAAALPPLSVQIILDSGQDRAKNVAKRNGRRGFRDMELVFALYFWIAILRTSGG